MAFTSVEIIALIVIVAAVIKMLVLLVNPQGWMNFARGIYKNTALAQIIGLILAGVVFYYIYYVAGMTIVQILAVMAFLAALLMVGLAPHIGDLLKKYQGQIKRGRLWQENWLYTLIWIVLLIWGAKELFM
jgi:hypothetical protein